MILKSIIKMANKINALKNKYDKDVLIHLRLKYRLALTNDIIRLRSKCIYQLTYLNSLLDYLEGRYSSIEV